MLAVRGHRVRPGTDDKVLAGWNGLAITGLVAAWKATGQDRGGNTIGFAAIDAERVYGGA